MLTQTLNNPEVFHGENRGARMISSLYLTMTWTGQVDGAGTAPTTLSKFQLDGIPGSTTSFTPHGILK